MLLSFEHVTKKFNLYIVCSLDGWFWWVGVGKRYLKELLCAA
jgi:hypothetical protein